MILHYNDIININKITNIVFIYFLLLTYSSSWKSAIRLLIFAILLILIITNNENHFRMI